MLIPHRIARRLVSCLGLLVAAWPLTVAEAKGPFDLLVVCDGLGTCFEVADPPLLDFFSFADFTQPLEDDPQPKPEAASLLITRYGLDRTSGEFIPFDRLRYYGDVAGSAGYVYYEGLIEGRSEYDGHWYFARPGVSAALEEAEATAQSSPEPMTASSLRWAVVAALAVGGLGGVALARRSRDVREAAKSTLG